MYPGWKTKNEWSITAFRLTTTTWQIPCFYDSTAVENTQLLCNLYSVPTPIFTVRAVLRCTIARNITLFVRLEYVQLFTCAGTAVDIAVKVLLLSRSSTTVCVVRKSFNTAV